MELIGSIPFFGGAFSALIAFVIALSVIVAIHEYGHYIVGRWCGIHAEVFSLGFGKTLVSWHDKRGTKWQIAAIPFGGYVRFLGDADASSRNDPDAIAAMDETTRSRSFHGAALYKKALTVVAGPVANFILTFLVFMGLVWFTGIAVEPPTIGSLKSLPDSVNELREGDVVRSINGTPIEDYASFYAYGRETTPGPVQTYEVLRDGQTLSVKGPFPLMPLVESIQPQSAAMAAGLQPGDVILSLDGVPLVAFSELQAKVGASNGAPLALTIWRAGQYLDITLSGRQVDIPNGQGGFESRVLIGIGGGVFFEPRTYTPGLSEMAEISASRTVGIVTTSLSAIYHIIKGKISACNLQGPIGMAGTAGDTATQGLSEFVNFIAVLSTAIGLLNLFPVPVLDGGHLVFFAYEAIARRKPNEKVMNVMMTTGLVLVLGLMVFAFSADIFCRWLPALEGFFQ